MIDLLLGAPRLLRGHVVRRPHDGARLGRVGLVAAGQPLGDPEVEHLDDLVFVVLSEEDIGRLEVAVDEPHVVRAAERLAHVAQHAGGLLEREPPSAAEPRAQVFAFEQLHRDVGGAMIDAVLEDLHHVRVP